MKHELTRTRQISADNTDNLLKNVPALIEKTFPIPQKFKNALPSDIAELSRLLTNKRAERSLSYLTRPNFLSAYLYYFMPWNLYRLCLLLPSLDIKLSVGDAITDFGCGPLTFSSALWIARPELRKIPLEINCIDRSGPALEAGKKFFTALCKSTDNIENPAWKINCIKEDIDFRKTNKPSKKTRKPASLVCAVNLFNEVYENISHNNSEELKRMAANAAALMRSEAANDAYILTVEPGVPQSGKFISFLRDEFIKLGRLPLAPCTHAAACPFFKGASKITRGRNWIDTKKRWCHFAFETFSAPRELLRLSASARLPKDRLVFSFLLAAERRSKENRGARVISDAFQLPENRFGRYACSERGLILITGERDRIEDLNSFSFIPQNNLIEFSADKQYDKKSGAQIMGV